MFKKIVLRRIATKGVTVQKKDKTLAQTELNQKNYQSLLFALCTVLLPHFFYLPIALTVLMVTVLVGWQFLLIRTGNFRIAQNKSLQYSVVILGLGIIYLQFKTFLGVEAGCSTLALILLGKAFEVKNYRDAIIQLNFALFVVAALFLYGQGMILAIAALVGVSACLYGMYQLQSYHNAYEEVLIQDVSVKQLRQQAYKTVIKLLLLAAPLMVVLFLFFPRIPPLWSIPTPNHQAKTGISDEMSPGDIASLSQSSELAFRVVFDQPQQMPDRSQLYWRAMVLDNFDGLKWTQHYLSKYAPSIRQERHQQLSVPRWYSQANQSNSSFQMTPYRMILEPNFQHWVYALDYSISAEPMMLKPDFSVQIPFPLSRRQQFELQLLKPSPMTDIVLDEKVRMLNLHLPQQVNKRSQAFAEQLFIQQGQNPQRYAEAILSWIREENFSYTLSPPLLNGDRVDDFLFRTRSGFCEHYASAYTNLMRMVGIPARVVVGYQGGKAAPDGASWEVRQLDAHAWTEVWFEGRGWVRIDPTAAIAPERVEMGMQDFSQQNNSVFGDQNFPAWQAQQMRWLTQARVWMDYANYQWQSKVVGFDQNRQRDWLKKLSIDNLSEQLILLILAIVSMVGLVVWWLSRQQKISLSKLDQALSKLSKRLQADQLQRLDNEAILTWLARIRHVSSDDQRLMEIINLYTRHMYIQSLSDTELKRLYKLLGKYTVKRENH